jgi:peptidoglycan/xylan/chitin deacetylase (PgdA/CDA1 family)
VPLALLYHAAISLPAALPPWQRTLAVGPSELDWQFGELRRAGYRSLTLAEYQAALESGQDDDSGVLLTFDDAYAHVLETVSPLLQRHGLTAALFVPVAHIGGCNDWDGPDVPLQGYPLASRLALREAAQGPWELASHGLSHVDLRTLTGTERREQLRLAREQLSELADEPVSDLAYPYGLANQEVRADARAAGYRMAFSARPEASDDRYALPRLVIRGQEGRTAFKIKLEPEFRHVFG